MSADTPEREWLEKVEAARRTKERLGPLAAEKAKKYEGLTLEQVMAHWARVTSRRGGCEFESLDDLEVEVMAMPASSASRCRNGARCCAPPASSTESRCSRECRLRI